MNRYNRICRMNQNSSATADNPIEMGDLPDDEEKQEDSIYFEIVPGQNEISEEETLEKLSNMGLEDIKDEYYRLMNISEVNQEMMNQFDEKLEKQDREVELQMTLAESVQTENDKWMKKLGEAKCKHKNYKDEESRIKCEHITYQTEAVMLEEKCEALKPDIRELVEEIEESRVRRKLLNEAKGANVEQIAEEAEKLVKLNVKNYEILGKLKSELNKLKLDLLEDDESEGEAADDDGNDNEDERNDGFAEADDKSKKLPNLLSGAFDIDLIDTPSIDPTTDTPHGKINKLSSSTMIPNTSVHPSVKSLNLVEAQIGITDKPDMSNHRDGQKSSLNRTPVPKKVNTMPPTKANNQRWAVADTRCIDKGMKVTSVPTNVKCDKTKPVESLRQIHRKQQTMRMKQANERNTDLKSVKDKHSLASNSNDKKLKPITANVNIENNVKSHLKTRNLVPVPPPPANRKKTTAIQRKSSIKDTSKHEPKVVEMKQDKLGGPSVKSVITHTPSSLSRPVKDNPTMGSNKGQSLEYKRTKLPPINPPTPKGQNKKGPNIKSITVENTLPRIPITANNKIRENGIICDARVVSTRPMYAEKSVHRAGVTKTNKSTGKERIGQSEVTALEVVNNKTEKGIKLMADRKLSSKRQK